MAEKDYIVNLEDLKYVNDKIGDLKSAFDSVTVEAEFDFTSVELSNYSITSSNKWSNPTSSTVTRSYCIPIPGNVASVRVQSDENSTSIIAWLNSNNPVSGGSVDFSTGHNGRIVLDAGASSEYIVNHGTMNYLYVLLISSSGADMGSTVYLRHIATDSTLTEQTIPADAKATGDAIAVINTDVDNIKNDIDKSIIVGNFDYANIVDLTNFGLANTKKWTTANSQRSYTFKIPAKVKKIRVTAHSTGSIIALLNSYSPVVGETADFATAYDGRIVLEANQTVDYTITGDMHYLFALVKSTTGDDKAPTLKLYCTDNVLDPVDTETETETEKTDRSTEIVAMLNAFGECKLSKGVFYTAGNFHMPNGSMLTGSGHDTVLKLLASTVSGSTVLMGASCTVKGLTVKGADSTKTNAASEGTRNGIEWTGETQEAGVVDNCWILNFDGSGIYLHDTTQKTYRNLSIANCYIFGNYVGVDIRQNSEFNKIANCTIVYSAIGYRNRGGNNDLANSGIDANKIGILIDADAGSNNGHGTITGCSINHSNSNTGYGIIIKDTGRMLVSNCNLYYSKLKLDTTNGNVISGCGFGTSAAWEVTGGECSIFIGCMVRGWDSENTPVTITNNSTVQILNCYDRDGVAYSN